MPKYKGDLQDWLDTEECSQGLRPSKRSQKVASQGSFCLSQEEANAWVVEVFPNQCRVILDPSLTDPLSRELLCTYKRGQLVGRMKKEYRERTPVTVGDRIRVRSIDPLTGVVEGVCVRKNQVSRSVPGNTSSRLVHVLAANLDRLVIVASVRDPEFSLGLVDRFLVAAEFEKIPALLCINKSDLSLGLKNPEWNLYRDLGYEVFEVSAHFSLGLEELVQKILNQTVLFCGQSGVGKTSLLRKLLGSEVGRVGAVNPQTGKGRHTTTGAVLLGGPQSSRWIDTPGVKEFGLFQVSRKTLAQGFPEFGPLACHQNGCQHLGELDCHAKALARYSSYRRIYESLNF